MGTARRDSGGDEGRESEAAPRSGPRAKKAALKRQAEAAGSVAERRIRERPPAPWDPFPLTELAIFVGIVLLVLGVLIAGSTGKGLLAAGAVLACIGGLETALREHFAGYRAHSGLLCGAATLATLLVSAELFGAPEVVSAAVAVGVFAVLFPVLRRGFVRKSGGRGVL